MDCYKVLRPNLTDCYSGTKDFGGVGVTTTEATYDGRKECGRGLHACFKPHECNNYRNHIWPVRLFSATVPDEAHVAFNGKLKAGSMTLVEELPLPQLFEFNGEKLVAYLNRIMAIQWWKPQEQARARVTDLCVQHMQRVARFGLGDVCPVRIVTGSRVAAWASARASAWDSAREAEYLVVSDLVDWPSPWEPLVSILELGYEPMGVFGGEFWVWEPEVAAHA
jgi:hypothetical protein